MRQTFSPVASPAASSSCGELVVVDEEAGVLLAERDDDGAGERRQVDDEARLEALLRVPEHVGQHEPPLGVGVEDLDGLARHAP